MLKQFSTLLAFLLAFAVMVPAFAQEATEEPMAEEAIAEGTITDIVVNNPSFNILEQAVIAAGLDGTLSGGEFTVFAPVDGAFETLISETGVTAEDLLADTDALTSILTYHVVEGTVLAEDLVGLIEEGEGTATVTTVNGAPLTFSVGEEGNVLVNGGEATVTATDTIASNGVVHVIDNVLVSMGNMAMDEEMAAEDMEATEEMAMEDMATEEAMMDEEMAMEEGTVVDVVVNTPELGTLEAAVIAADLADTLAGGEFTVFAPRDGAFETLLTELDVTAEDLLADTDALTPILTYHVVPGTITAEDLVAAIEAGEGSTSVETVQGASLTFTISEEGSVLINGGEATVTATDLTASNGVVHIIDNVLTSMEDMGDMSMEEAMDDAMMDATEEPMMDDMDMATEEAMDDAMMDATEEMAMEDMDPDMAEGTVVDVVVNTPELGTLEAAVIAAGLDGTLASGEFTVFAPRDGAFTTLLSELGTDAETLLADTDALTPILTYHVVPGTITAETLVGLIEEGEGSTTVETVNGATLTFTVSEEGSVLINGGEATVTATDLTASNGVVHIIDNVLVPAAE